MVSHHRHGGNVQGGEFVREDAGFFRQTGVGQVAREQHEVGRFRDRREERLERPGRCSSTMKIAGCRKTHFRHSGRSCKAGAGVANGTLAMRGRR
jgi:hypothetical protein